MGKKNNAHAIDNTVRLDEGILKIGNRLQMQLPPDWHIHEDEITEGVNHVSFYKGLKQIGHMGLGATAEKQLEAEVSMRMLLQSSITGAGDIVDATLRDDNRLCVYVSASVQGTGTSFAQLSIVEKDLDDLRTIVFIELAGFIPNLEDRLQSIRDAERGPEHYLGEEWDSNWQSVSFMASTVSKVGDVIALTPLGNRMELSYGFSAQLPAGMKRLDGKKVGSAFDLFYRTNATPSINDFNSREQDYIILFKEEEVGSDGRELALVRQFVKFNNQSNESQFAEPIYEKKFSAGYIGIFINYEENDVNISVEVMTLKLQHICFALLNSSGRKTVAELVAIACDIADTIELNGEHALPMQTGSPRISAKTGELTPDNSMDPGTETKKAEGMDKPRKQTDTYKGKEKKLSEGSNEDSSDYHNWSWKGRKVREAKSNRAFYTKYRKYIAADPVISFEGKIFVFSGMFSEKTAMDEPIVRAVLARNGEYRKQISGLSDYLVIESLDSVAESVISAAVEQLDKGKNLQIITAESLVKALDGHNAGTNPPAKTAAKPAGATATKPAAKTVSKPATTATKPAAKTTAAPKSGTAKKPAASAGTRPAAKTPVKKQPLDDGIRRLKLTGQTKITKSQYIADQDTRPVEIPEGITEIENSAFQLAHMSAVRLPKSLRIISEWSFNSCSNLESVEIQEGLEEIGFMAFAQCPKLTTVELPSTIRSVDRNAFVDQIAVENTSKIIVLVSGEAARRIVNSKKYNVLSAIIAAGFVVDGAWYPTLEKYVEDYEAEQRARRERELALQRKRAEQERQEKARKEAEARREQEITATYKQIRELEKERDEATGLFAGLKRKKLQKQIDELREKLMKL